jgi:hypothetical protein
MNNNMNLRFGCMECLYFSNQNSDVKKHLLTKKHINKVTTTEIDPNWKYQCKICNKKCNSQSALHYHNKKCKIQKPEEVLVTNQELMLQNILNDNIEMKKMIQDLKDNQQPSNITNNNVSIINNIKIFLDEKCQNAMNMGDFMKGIKFSAENFESGNLLLSTALEHTASIFEDQLNKMTIYERPIHNFKGEDQNQSIAHYRHNNEWKKQSEMSIMDEIYRDFNGNDPKDTFMYNLNLFHQNRLEYFDENHGGKRNYLRTNLNFTTYCEQQIDLVRKILELSKVEHVSNHLLLNHC